MARNYPGQIFNPDTEIYSNDLNRVVRDAQEQIGELLAFSQVLDGGLFRRPTLSADINKVKIDRAIGIDSKGRIVNIENEEIATSQADIGKYIVVKVSLVEDPTYNRATIHTGQDVPTRNKYEYSIELWNSLPEGKVGDGYVVVGKIFDYDTTDPANPIPVIQDRAVITFASGSTTLKIYPRRFIPMPTPHWQYFDFEASKYAMRAVLDEKLYREIRCYEQTEAYLDNGLPFSRLLVVHIGVDENGNHNFTFGDIRDAINSQVSSHWLAEIEGDETVAWNWFGNNPREAWAEVPYQLVQFKIGSGSLDNFTHISGDDPYTAHILRKGNGVVSENNPHGLSLEDLGWEEEFITDHIWREHNRKRSAISKGSSVGFLGISNNNNTLILTGKISDKDRAIVKGHPVTELGNANSGNNWTYTLTEAEKPFFALYEIGVMPSSFVYKKEVIKWEDIIGEQGVYYDAGGHRMPVVSTIAKQKFMEGEYTLVLQKNGSDFSVRLVDDSNAVDMGWVDLSWTEPVRLYTWNGYWIDVMLEPYATSLNDGEYKSRLVITKSEDNENTLPCAYAFWRGGEVEWGWYGGGEFVDLRKYGTLAFEEDAYHVLSGITFPEVAYEKIDDKPTLLVYKDSPYGNVVELSPFKVIYRGMEYEFDYQIVGSVDVAANYVVYLEFDEVGNVDIKIRDIDHSPFASVNLDKMILLGTFYYDGSNIDRSNSYFAPQSMKRISYSNILLGDGYWDWNSFVLFSMLYNKANVINSFTVTLMGRVTGDMEPIAPMGHITIKGNYYTLQNVYFYTYNLTVTDALIVNAQFRTGEAAQVKFYNVYWVDVYTANTFMIVNDIFTSDAVLSSLYDFNRFYYSFALTGTGGWLNRFIVNNAKSLIVNIKNSSLYSFSRLGRFDNTQFLVYENDEDGSAVELLMQNSIMYGFEFLIKSNILHFLQDGMNINLFSPDPLLDYNCPADKTAGITLTATNSSYLLYFMDTLFSFTGNSGNSSYIVNLEAYDTSFSFGDMLSRRFIAKLDGIWKTSNNSLVGKFNNIGISFMPNANEQHMTILGLPEETGIEPGAGVVIAEHMKITVPELLSSYNAQMGIIENKDTFIGDIKGGISFIAKDNVFKNVLYAMRTTIDEIVIKGNVFCPLQGSGITLQDFNYADISDNVNMNDVSVWKTAFAPHDVPLKYLRIHGNVFKGNDNSAAPKITLYQLDEHSNGIHISENLFVGDGYDDFSGAEKVIVLHSSCDNVTALIRNNIVQGAASKNLAVDACVKTNGNLNISTSIVVGNYVMPLHS